MECENRGGKLIEPNNNDVFNAIIKVHYRFHIYFWLIKIHLHIKCVILKHHYAFFSFKDYQETTKNHFWVGVHQIEYQGIWGFQQGGPLNDSHIPFLVWRNPENDNDYCADMTKHYGMWKSPCAEKKPYICESGKLDKNVKKYKTNLM